MGHLVDGVWKDVPRDTRKTGGEFIRSESQFRDRVTADGSSGFKAESGRYHLYASLGCPWATRTIMYRVLKGLENAISLTILGPLGDNEGWPFVERPPCTPDPLGDAKHMYDIYLRANPRYSGLATVPALWDKAKKTIVNNESSEIIRMFNREFDAFAEKDLPDMVPEALRPQIDRWNGLIYRTVNNGVYRAGFATSQEKYEEAVKGVFSTLDAIDLHLRENRYLCGNQITEADWRLFPTLARFDVAYHYHFKCNLKRLEDYPNLWGYARELYQVPGIAQTVNIEHIKDIYYRSQTYVNPSRVVPIGPSVNFAAPHGRGNTG